MYILSYHGWSVLELYPPPSKEFHVAHHSWDVHGGTLAVSGGRVGEAENTVCLPCVCAIMPALCPVVRAVEVCCMFEVIQLGPHV
ncbi:hypothetical protein CsSME_00006170 [Camellia sinensis var. sinensis]